MIAPDRMNSGIAIRGKLVAPLYIVIATLGSMSTPCVATSATTATTPERDRDRNVEQDEHQHSPEQDEYLHVRSERGRRSGDQCRRSARSLASAEARPRAARMMSGMFNSSATMNSAQLIGMTDCVHATETAGKLIR